MPPVVEMFGWMKLSLGMASNGQCFRSTILCFFMRRGCFHFSFTKMPLNVSNESFYLRILTKYQKEGSINIDSCVVQKWRLVKLQFVSNLTWQVPVFLDLCNFLYSPNAVQIKNKILQINFIKNLLQLYEQLPCVSLVTDYKQALCSLILQSYSLLLPTFCWLLNAS